MAIALASKVATGGAHALLVGVTGAVCTTPSNSAWPPSPINSHTKSACATPPDAAYQLVLAPPPPDRPPPHSLDDDELRDESDENELDVCDECDDDACVEIRGMR